VFRIIAQHLGPDREALAHRARQAAEHAQRTAERV
jgi:hypothetical protein